MDLDGTCCASRTKDELALATSFSLSSSFPAQLHSDFVLGYVKEVSASWQSADGS